MKKIAIEEHFSTPELGRIREVWTKRIGLNTSVNPEVGMRIGRVLGDFDEMRIPEMDANEVAMQVVSTSSPSVQGIEDPAEAVAKAIEINDALYEQVTRRPDRFAGFATLPMQDPAAAAKELERTVTKLGFKGALVHGHTNFEYLDEQKFWSVWECAASLKVPIYLHPNEPDPTQLKIYTGYPELMGATWNWGVETGTHALRIALSGVFDEFPDAQLIVGHLGENIPYALWRLERHWKDAVKGEGMNVTNVKHRLKKTPSEYMRENVFVTTSGNFSPESLRCAIDVLGVDRVLFAVDYPFESTREASVFIENAPLTQEEREKICYKNAERLFGLST